jgi:CRP-like cAMP-binding protein
MQTKLWYLKKCDLFERLTADQADRLERRAFVLTCPRRSLIYSSTEPGQSVMVLASGRVKIKALTPDGKETILAFIEEGEIFGELALLDRRPRGEFAEAIEDCQILVIPREEMLWLLERRPDVSLCVTKLVGLRRRRIENRLTNVLFLPSRERMVRLLLELIDSDGIRRGNICEIRPRFSHQDLAGLIGMTREMVTRVLGQLRTEGLIAVRRMRITVTDCKRLAQSSDQTASDCAGRRPREKAQRV